jgi:outer membrane immunogenic protein
VNKIILAASVLALSATSAWAADMAPRPYTKAPVMVDPVYSWTGWYIGGNVGYGFGRSGADTVLDPTSSWAIESPAFRNELIGLSNQRYSPQGVVGGGQVGYNYQADINASGMSKTIALSGLNGGFITRNFTETTKSDWFATVRPRLGYAVNNTLWYATGGLAVGDVQGSWTLLSSNGYNKTGSGSETKVGWTVGAGVEHAFQPNWTVKLEYLYTDLGSISYNSTYIPGSTFAPPGFNYRENISQDFTFHTVRVGLNYKFGSPVVARY